MYQSSIMQPGGLHMPVFGEPTIIYGDPQGGPPPHQANPHQRYDYSGGQNPQYDQNAVQQQMYVNNAAVQNQSNGMGQVYMAAGVQQQ